MRDTSDPNWTPDDPVPPTVPNWMPPEAYAYVPSRNPAERGWAECTSGECAGCIRVLSNPNRVILNPIEDARQRRRLNLA